MDGRTSLRVYGALSFSMIVWGLSFLAIKNVVEIVPVFSLSFVRFAVAAILLGLLGLPRRRLVVPRRGLLAIAGLALLSPVGYFLFETYGISLTLASHASILIAAIPTVVYIIAFARRQEPATWRKTIGILLAFFGVLAIIVSAPAERGASLVGDLLVLGAVLCAAVRTTLVKDALRRVTPLQLTFYQFALSLAVFGPLAATDDPSWIGAMTPALWAQVLFLAVCCSAAAYLAMHFALKHISASRVSVTADAVPIVTILAEAVLLGVPLTWIRVVGAALTLVGVVVTQVASPERSSTRLVERGG
jgi:drug/metabolite transporter (DMT)-like permease